MADYSPEMRLPAGAALPPAPAPPQPTGEISFRQVFNVLRRRYRLVLLVATLGAAVGAFLASREPPRYQATAVLRMVGDRRAFTGGIEAPTPEVSRLTDPVLSLVQLVQSRSVLGMVVDSLGLQLRSQTPEFLTSELSHVVVDPRATADSVVLEFAPDRVAARYGNRRIDGAYGQVLPLGVARFAVNRPARPVARAVLGLSPREVAVDWLRDGLSIAPRQSTDLIDVAFESADPQLAQQIVNRTIESFQAFNIQSLKGKSHSRRVFLQEQLVQVGADLTEAQGKLAAFRSQLQIGRSEDKLAMQQNQLNALDQSRSELETERKTYTNLLRQVESGGAQAAGALRSMASLPAVANTGLYSRLSSDLFVLDSMTTGPNALAPGNPDLLAVRNRIQFAQGEVLQAVRAHIKTIDESINSIVDARRKSGQSIAETPQLVEQEIRLTGKVDALGKVNEQLQQELHGAHLAEAVEAGDVEIVDHASLPYQKVWTTASLKLVLGLVLGLMLGCGLAFVLEALNTSIRRPEDIESMLHIPGLAVIPRLEAGPAAGRSHNRGLVRGKAHALPRSTAAAVGTEMQPFSVGTEAFRMLRTSLVWSAEGGERLRTLVVTSAAPGEGKTLTAANLSVSFANDGLQVLLVDCDIRRPRLHGLFRMPRSPGLLDVLAPSNGGNGTTVRSLSLDTGGGADDDPLRHVLRPTPIRGLTLFPCGALPTNASNLLSGIRMRTLLQELTERFDLVILDTPPVLATADAGILGSLVDGVLLVVRAGQTDRTAAQRAYHQLTNVGSRVVGAVLNDPKGELSQYGEYYYPYEYVAERE